MFRGIDRNRFLFLWRFLPARKGKVVIEGSGILVTFVPLVPDAGDFFVVDVTGNEGCFTKPRRAGDPDERLGTIFVQKRIKSLTLKSVPEDRPVDLCRIFGL